MGHELPTLNFETYERQGTTRPVKVLQVGDGNFIRGFVDWMISEMNEKSGFNGRVVSIQATPRGRTTPKLNRQDGLFTLLLRGIEEGYIVNEKKVIDSVSKGINPYTEWSEVLKLAEDKEIEFLFSNTTEAGLRYEQEGYSETESPLSFAGKVVALLYHRFVHFEGQLDKGWILIPCELIEDNGDELKKICLKVIEDWKLPTAFVQWIHEACTFCNTLVDRIVPGYPKNEAEDLFAEFGYTDELLTVAEPYHLFVIEGPSFIEKKLSFKEAGLNVHFDKVLPYRELKVKLLNAPHTMLALVGLVAGIETVREGMEDAVFASYIESTLTEEVCATLHPSGKAKAQSYIKQVFDRFANPYLEHKLADISLNSYAKFKARIWPSIEAYRTEFGKNPTQLVFAFASLLFYFKGVQQTELRDYEVKDDSDVINKFQQFYKEFDGSKDLLVKFIQTLVQDDFSEKDGDYGDLAEAIAEDFFLINEVGIRTALLKMGKER